MTSRSDVKAAPAPQEAAGRVAGASGTIHAPQSSSVSPRPGSTQTRFRWADWREPSARFWKKVDKSAGPDGCWLWTGSCSQSGHGRFQANRMGEPRLLTGAHRFSYELKYGPIPDGMVVRHRCDNPRCVNPDHLELGTQLDNIADMQNRGRAVVPQATGRPGELNPNAKLSAENVAEIRRRREAGETGRAIAKEFGISTAQVSRIFTGKRWTS